MTGSSSLRNTFDEVALLYNEARPRYPSELFSTLIDIVGLNLDSTLLEIGPGTGQATIPLAQKGFDIIAIELGDSLAAVARHELRDYKNVQILSGAFEETPLSAKCFDLVYAATSFHWLDASIKYLKTHNILKDNGHLAIIHTNHVSDENGDSFFIASQPIYDRYGYTDKHQKPKLPKKEALKPNDADTHLFKVIHFHLFPVIITYTANSFVKLLNTFSNHLAADNEIQQAFYREIENLINKDFEGRIDKHFAMSLTIAKKCN
jgi:ubiquinone/menaquinone biosynthesis C-methylase UbiE